VARAPNGPLLDLTFAVTPKNGLTSAKRFLTEARDIRRWGRAWVVSLGIWVALDVLVQTQNYSWYREKGIPVPWPKFLGDYVDSAFWAFLTPFILLAVSRVPIERRTWRRAVPFHLLAGLAASAFWLPQLQTSRLVLAVFFDDASLFREMSASMGFRVAVEGLLLYTQVLAIGHGMHYYREYTARDLSASRLESQLAQAQLQILRMQLHPHFLFNTLNTISALIHKDVRAADRMLALLGDLLRDSFEKLGAQEVALKQELDFLDRYLEIEQTRFQDRLVVDKEIAPETLDALVPNLILQPLVENAIRHGIARRAGAGRIELRAWRDNGMLALRIRDDGPGLPTGASVSTRGGVGLANCQARLEQLYGRDHRFELSNRPEGGFEVVLAFPFRPCP
jgi:two-component system LytT family sensor kinase